MPGYITHYLFANQVLLHPSLKDDYGRFFQTLSSYRRVFNLGAQGPDLFFYHLGSNLNPKKKLGSIMHKQKTDDYFKTCLDYLSSLKDEQELKVFTSYFAGLLCHYTLDCTTHPFIYAHTGYTVGQSGGLTYLATHCQYESNIDHILLQKVCHCLPSEFNTSKCIRIRPEDAKSLANSLSETITATYFNNKSSYATPSFMRHAIVSIPTKVRFLQDRGGPKRKIIELLEQKTVKAPVLSCLFTVDHVTNPKAILNMEHTSWKNPWNLDQTFDSSFIELYKIALKEAEQRLEKLAAFYNTLPIVSTKLGENENRKQQLLACLNNYSYNSGQSWRLSF